MSCEGYSESFEEPKGEKGDPGHVGPQGMGPKGGKGEHGIMGTRCTSSSAIKRQASSGQTCCTALAKASYSGNSTEIMTSYIGQDVLLPCGGSGYPTPIR